MSELLTSRAKFKRFAGVGEADVQHNSLIDDAIAMASDFICRYNGNRILITHFHADDTS